MKRLIQIVNEHLILIIAVSFLSVGAAFCAPSVQQKVVEWSAPSKPDPLAAYHAEKAANQAKAAEKKVKEVTMHDTSAILDSVLSPEARAEMKKIEEARNESKKLAGMVKTEVKQ